jgi:RNA polymerase sigma factor (sigma-70 family)
MSFRMPAISFVFFEAIFSRPRHYEEGAAGNIRTDQKISATHRNLSAKRPKSLANPRLPVPSFRIVKATPLPIDLAELDSSAESVPCECEPGTDNSIIGGLFRAQASKMRRYLAFRLKNPEDAKDATQEVFLKLWRYERAGQLRKEASAYMYSASHTVAIDEERHRNYHERDRIPEFDLETIPASAGSVEDRIYWRRAVAYLVDGMEALPELTRDVFMLYHFEGLKYPQIAERLGVSERTVERHIALGTKALRARMKENL